MKGCAFHGVIKIRGINPFIAVSAARTKVLKAGWHKPLPVLVQVNGKPDTPSRTNLMPAGDGSFYLYLNGLVRKAAQVGVGDRVKVEIAFDANYRNGPLHTMPAWFRAALRGNATAAKNWKKLAPSRKKEVLRYFSQLKSAGARERNLARALDALSGSACRFMARSWKDGA